ncbi:MULTISPECIES: hypothetical protein [unclassified Corallococcus]|uniref:hypothetical protein n=1 Tax=unclassified Corallococcus TaxID=2685029 RepID=UPI001A8F153F|nr:MULTISPECIES: hypothetical protein [unclassified Corallococcus]MBN9681784.1 hypothetical protein [Corallococcus sp. NCSPR001]WAS86646.1 hypothetical protein O0N60_06630 [Corallococcus sp. NCRR]
MSPSQPALSVLLLSEDSGSDAFDTLERLAKEILKQVDAYTRTQPARLSFEPVRQEEALRALHANVWKSDKARDRRNQVELVRTLATQLMREHGWAFFHFDGDRPWSERASSENMAKFSQLIEAKVYRLIVEQLSALAGRAATPVAQREVEAQARQRMKRLKRIVPFYSIEAWLFQNTREAIRLCERHYGGRDADQFQRWEQERHALDEVSKPKERVCLGAKHNHTLASEAFPTRDVYAAGCSFASVVDDFRQDEELCEALQQTYTAPVTST